MKKLKKLLSIVLLVVFCFTSVPVEARTQGVNNTYTNLDVSEKYVRMNIYIESQDGVAAYQSSLEYDTSDLDYVKYEVGDLFAESLIDVNEEEEGTIHIAWVSNRDIATTGLFLRLYFEIEDDTEQSVEIAYEESLLSSLYGRKYDCTAGFYGTAVPNNSMYTNFILDKMDYTGGENITASISMNNNKGFSAFQCTVQYDSSKVAYQSYSLNIEGIDVLADVYDDKQGTITFALVAKEDVMKSGSFLKLKFKALNEVEGTTHFDYNVSQLNNSEMKNYPCDNWSCSANIKYKSASNLFSVITPESVSQEEQFETFVKIDKNAGFGAMDMVLEYDPEYLEAVSVEKGDVLSNALISSKIEDGKIVVGAVSASNLSDNGDVLKIIFRSKKKEAENTKLALSIGSLVDEKLEELDYSVKDATLTIAPEYLSGDVNGDKKINFKDSALIARYLAGWNVEINKKAADINGDGKINIQDRVLIARYLAGWDVNFKLHK